METIFTSHHAIWSIYTKRSNKLATIMDKKGLEANKKTTLATKRCNTTKENNLRKGQLIIFYYFLFYKVSILLDLASPQSTYNLSRNDFL